jgi:AraC-like DNA-binding protein
MVAAGFIYQLFAHLVENASIAVPGKQDALVLMDNMINRPDVTLAEIASTINYSQRHTARLIEKYYGTSLSQLRKDKKNE